jgi:hypothetical protein
MKLFIINLICLSTLFLSNSARSETLKLSPKLNDFIWQRVKRIEVKNEKNLLIRALDSERDSFYSQTRGGSIEDTMPTPANEIEDLDPTDPSLRRTPQGEEPEFYPENIPLTLPKSEEPPEFYKASPVITIMTPSGGGASWGTIGIGIGVQNRTRYTDSSDGVIGIGFGVGNPRENLGVQVGIALVDTTDPFADGTIGIKLHRYITDNLTMAVGFQDLVSWGEPDDAFSVYGVATQKFTLNDDRTEPFSEIHASLGFGTGPFRSESDIREDVDSVGIFGSLAVRVLEPLSTVVEWTGQDLTLGLSFVPFREIPLVIIPAVTDITGSAGDGTRFVFGVGYNFSF